MLLIENYIFLILIIINLTILIYRYLFKYNPCMNYSWLLILLYYIHFRNNSVDIPECKSMWDM